MGNRGVDTPYFWYRDYVAAVGGVVDKRGDELWTKHDEFYYCGGLEALVCRWCVCTIQIPVNFVLGISSLVILTGANIDPPCGRS